MKIFYLLTIILYLYYLIYKSKKYMHMLQQNWYNDGDRYFRWVIENYKKCFLIFDILFIIFIPLYFISTKVSIIVFVCYCLFAFLIRKSVERKEQSKKPLVITPRIKRLYVTMLIVYLIYISITVICYSDIMVSKYYFFMGLLLFMNPFVVLFANIINKPIEKMVFNHYKRLAKSKLKSMTNMKRIGITGSYGKTTSKNVLNEILNVKYNSYTTEKSFNTMNGLMKSINNRLDKFTDIFIAEMGAFKRGEIKEKCDFIEPQYGILTTVGTAHLESFGSRENIQEAKFELINSLPDDGIAVLNMDDEYQKNYKVKSNCKVVWVSINNKNADVYASDIKLSSEGTKFTCNFKEKKESVVLETKLLGNANVYNILQACALSYYLGLTTDQIRVGVKRLKPIEHRLELRKYSDNITIIDDAYNSNPVGSSMALDVLDMMNGKKIVVTPGMIELGEEQYKYNMEFGKHIAKVCDEVILIGKEQTKPILEGLKKEKFNENKIHVLNDVKAAFPLINKLGSGKKTYALLENDLPDIFNE